MRLTPPAQALWWPDADAQQQLPFAQELAISERLCSYVKNPRIDPSRQAGLTGKVDLQVQIVGTR